MRKSFKKALSLLMALAISVSLITVPVAAADEYTDVEMNGTIYRTFNLQELGANAKTFVNSLTAEDIGTTYKVPDYQGTGASETDSITFWNAAKTEEGKNEGLLNADNGVPFDIKTDTDKANTILLGGGVINKDEGIIDVEDGKYKKLSIVADVTYAGLEQIDFQVKYAGEENWTGPAWQIGAKKAYYYTGSSASDAPELERSLIVNSVKNGTAAASVLEMPAESAYSYNYTNTNYGTMASYYQTLLPVYELALDPAKTVTEVRIANRNAGHSLNVFALTATLLGEYINPTEPVTIDEAGEKVIYNDFTVDASKNQIFTMDLSTVAGSAGDGQKEYSLYAIIDGTKVTLAEWQHMLFYTAGESAWNGAGTLRLDTAGYDKVEIVFDVATATYVAKRINADGEVQASAGTTDSRTLTGITADGTLEITEIGIEGIGVTTGASSTVGNFSMVNEGTEVADTTLDTADETITYTVDNPVNGANGIFSFDFTIPDTSGNKSQFALDAKIGGETVRFMLFGGECLCKTTIGENSDWELVTTPTGGTLWLPSLTKAGEKYTMKVELDLANKQLRVLAADDITSAWIALPATYTDSSEVAVEAVSIVRRAEVESHAITVSNIAYEVVEEDTTLDTANETLTYTVENPVNGANGIFSFDFTIPNTSGNTSNFALDAKIGDETVRFMLFGGEVMFQNKLEGEVYVYIKTIGGGTFYLPSLATADGKYTMKVEFDLANKQFRVIGANEVASAWAELPANYADGSAVAVEAISIIGRYASASDSTTISNIGYEVIETVIVPDPVYFDGTAVEIDIPGEEVKYAVETVSEGKDTNLEIEFTRPTNGTGDVVEFWATLVDGGDEYKEKLFSYGGDGWIHTNEGTNFQQTDENGNPKFEENGNATPIYLTHFAAAEGDVAKIKIEIDLSWGGADDASYGKFRLLGYKNNGELVSTSTWVELPYNLSDYEYSGISEISLKGAKNMAHSSTISAMSISVIDPDAPPAPVEPLVIQGADSWNKNGKEYLFNWVWLLKDCPGAYGVDGTRPVVVEIPDGTYRFDSVADLTGYAGSKGANVTFRPAEDAEVIFKGSKLLDATQFAAVTDEDVLAKIPEAARDKVQVLNLAEQGITKEMIGEVPTDWRYFDDRAEKAAIYVNNIEQTNARWPNGDNEYKTFLQRDGDNAIVIADSQKAANWATAPEARLIGFLSNDYTYDRVKITGINGGTITFNNTNKNGNIVTGGTSISKRYAVYNLLEELDVPGEYYIDSANCLLYYYPAGEIDTLEISVQNELVKLQNTSNYTFEGITFSQVKDSAFYITTGSDNITIEECTFENISRYGLNQLDLSEKAEVGKGTSQEAEYLNNGNENFKLINNTFNNIGYSAFDLVFGSRDANVPSNSSITGNYIYNIGRNNKKGQAGRVLGVGVNIANNTIHRTGYGIRFDSDYTNINNNEIFNVMNHLDDGAAIYTGRDFINRNNEIFKNYIHDVNGIDVWNWGIYLDDSNVGTKVYQNIIADAHEGIAINNGSRNEVTDNTIVNTDGEYIVNLNISTWEEWAKGSQNSDAVKDISKFKTNIETNQLAAYDALASDFAASDDWYKAINNKIQNNVAYGSKVDTDGSDYLKGSNNFIYTSAAESGNTFGGDIELTDRDAFDDNFLLKEKLNGSNALAVSDNVTFGSTIKMQGGALNINYPIADSYVASGAVEFGWDAPAGADKFVITVKNASGETVATAETLETYFVTEAALADGAYTVTVTAASESVNSNATWTSGERAFNVGEEPDTVTTKTVSGDNTVFTVTVNGEEYTGNEAVYVAVYNTDGKLLAVKKAVDCVATFATSEVSEATDVKTFVWAMDISSQTKTITPLWAAEEKPF